MHADRSAFPKLLIPPLFSGFAAVMAEAPSEAAIQESQVVPSKCPPSISSSLIDRQHPGYWNELCK